MTQALGAAALVLIGASCVVGNPTAADKVPGVLPDRTAAHVNLSYNPAGHSVATRKLDLYLPAASGTAAPVIVWVHGGGWEVGDKADKSSACKSILAQVQRGFAVASINYRLSGEAIFPAPVQDVKLAVRWLKANAATYGLDANAVIVAGESAGGHLVALAAVSQGQFELNVPGWPNSTVKAVIDFVGPTNMQAFHEDSPWRFYAGTLLGCPVIANGPPRIYDCAEAVLEAASATTYLDSADPAVYMAYGDGDPVVAAQAQGRVAAEQWALALGKTLEQSDKVWFDLVDGGGHNIAPQTAELPPNTPEEQRKTYNFAALQRFLDTVAPR
jgi:acetyl esterase/lipase